MSETVRFSANRDKQNLVTQNWGTALKMQAINVKVQVLFSQEQTKKKSSKTQGDVFAFLAGVGGPNYRESTAIFILYPVYDMLYTCTCAGPFFLELVDMF